MRVAAADEDEILSDRNGLSHCVTICPSGRRGAIADRGLPAATISCDGRRRALGNASGGSDVRNLRNLPALSYDMVNIRDADVKLASAFFLLDADGRFTGWSAAG